MKKLGVLLALLVAGGAAALTFRPSPSSAAVPAGPRVIVAPGKVEAVSERIDLAFEQVGRVTEVLVVEGNRVEKGQVLARLDDRQARARVARAEALVLAASARRDAAVHGSRAEDIRRAEAELATAQAQSRDRAIVERRAKNLVGQAAISVAEADSAEQNARAAEGQVAAAEAHLTLLRRGTREEDRRAAAAEVAQAQAELDEARVLLDQTTLKAPRAGTILRRNVEPGEQMILLPPTVALAMADLEHLQLRAEVDEADVGGVTAGQRGYATAEAYGDKKVAGHVERLMQELGRKQVVTDDPRAKVDTRVLEVLFVPDAGQGPLPLGLRMDVHLEDQSALSTTIGSTRVARLAGT